jgi:hypothetical protein
VSDELKIVIYYKGDKATVGISKPDCDPILGTIEGDLPDVLDHIPGLVEEAKDTWSTTPRFKKFEGKLPSQDTPAPRTTTTTRQTTPAPKKDQPVLF